MLQTSPRALPWVEGLGEREGEGAAEGGVGEGRVGEGEGAVGAGVAGGGGDGGEEAGAARDASPSAHQTEFKHNNGLQPTSNCWNIKELS